MMSKFYLVPAVLGLLVALPAFAGTATGSFGQQINVDPACRISAPSQIDTTLSMSVPLVTVAQNVSIVCPKGTAYTLETNATATGSKPATNGPLSIPLYVYRGAPGGAILPFGPLSASQHASGTSTGNIDQIPFWLSINSTDGVSVAAPVPRGGFYYSSTITWTLTY